MNVRDAMATTIGTADVTASLAEVARIMAREDCGFVPIMRAGTLAGVITDRDLVIRCMAQAHDGERILEAPVGDCMTRDPRTITPDATLEEAAHVMAEHHVRRLPVMEGRRLVGVLSFGNLEQALHARGRAAEEAVLGVTEGA